jgi:2'-deoxynucleoside 5'-phosphate N-hydrolase
LQQGQVRAFLSVKYHADGGNRAHVEQLCAALAQAGYEVLCVVRNLEAWGQVRFPPDELMRRTFELLASCDVVVVDLCEKGVGVGIEAGYACARSIPVVAMARQGCDISATLQGIARRVFWYGDYADIPRLFVS